MLLTEKTFYYRPILEAFFIEQAFLASFYSARQ